MLRTISIYQKLHTKQVDFSIAFVQAKLKEDVHIYVDAPKGYEYSDGEVNETYVLKLDWYKRPYIGAVT